jgi:hypothetical protein
MVIRDSITERYLIKQSHSNAFFNKTTDEEYPTNPDIELPQVKTPTFTPESGEYFEFSIEVTFYLNLETQNLLTIFVKINFLD